MAQKLLQTEYVSDAVALVVKLGGEVRYVKRGILSAPDVEVRILGESRRFETEYDMVVWVRNTIVPKVLSS